MDFKYDRIYNGWITLGILLGLSLHIWKNGWHDMSSAITAMLLAFCILYPIYKIGALGGGDVKLFIMVGSFLSIDHLLHVIVVSFIIGAIFSLGKMILEANFVERMKYLSYYLSDVLCSGQWKLYGENPKDDFSKCKSNKIHFSLPICFSVMIVLGGMF